MVVGENRVLRIVGMQLAQHGLSDLFEQIYAIALDDAGAEPGDGRRFQRAELREP